MDVLLIHGVRKGAVAVSLFTDAPRLSVTLSAAVNCASTPKGKVNAVLLTCPDFNP
jgi:hypothetical protein